MTHRQNREDRIEQKVDRMIDHLDYLLHSGLMTRKDYHLAMCDLGKWAHAKRSGLEEKLNGTS